jgi:F-type H+-transporting ATPase subunit b
MGGGRAEPRARASVMSLFRRTASLTIGGMLLLPAAAFAEAVEEKGMPQLAFGNPLTLSQVVWGAIIFVVLYTLLARTALPQVGAVLEQRAQHIARDLESAQAAKARADAGMTDAAEATARARAEAQAAIAAAVDEAKRAAALQAETLNERLDQQLRDAEAQIAQARNAAMGALRQVASDTATTVVTRLTGRAPDQRRLDAAIGSALAARGQG